MKFHTPEGATPLEDISSLKLVGITTYKQLCNAEAENILKALRRHLTRPKQNLSDWFSLRNLLSLHRDMFGDVWRWAGRYRHSVTNIGVPPGTIHIELMKLIGDVRYWLEDPHAIPLLEQAARLHHRLVSIHPWENGNGRHARLVSDIYLRAHQQSLPKWPTDLSDHGKTRRHYLSCLKAADRGDIQPLIALMNANR